MTEICRVFCRTVCRDYVGTMSVFCRTVCRYCVGTMSDRMSGITGCMSDMVSLELGLESGCLDLSPAFTTDDRFRPDFRQPTRQPMGGGGGGW